jgi:two-component system, NtrC family, response regulator GlrR
VNDRSRTLSFRVVGDGAGARGELPPMRLVVVEGPDAGASFASEAERFTIGSDPRADMILHDRTVSRFHAEIAIEDDRVAIHDLGSHNGTFVDDVSIVHAYLAPAARIRIGATVLAFSTEGAPIRVALGGEQFGAMVGRSPVMRAVFARLARAAASDATVLLTGETGTGKELAAEAVHAASKRAAGPFAIVDCAAVARDLIESELFGHERGAFTGAHAARPGAFESAHGGTVFLDEIGELELDLQPKLLRALERREVKRVGSDRWQPIDVRIVAATNRDLRAEVNAGRFRSDLYYRLAVIEVRLPSLRERRDDLPLIVDALLDRMGMAACPEARLLRSPEGQAELARHPWPGNVRELRNYVERCVAMAERPPLVDAREPAPADDLRTARKQWTAEREKAFLEDLLVRHDGNVSAAARAAGYDRKHLYRLLWRHGLR